jgi:hypothetical protein
VEGWIELPGSRIRPVGPVDDRQACRRLGARVPGTSAGCRGCG